MKRVARIYKRRSDLVVDYNAALDLLRGLGGVVKANRSESTLEKGSEKHWLLVGDEGLERRVSGMNFDVVHFADFKPSADQIYIGIRRARGSEDACVKVEGEVVWTLKGGFSDVGRRMIAKEKHQIVKYVDRKFYSRKLSRYVTQSDLIEIIQGGEDLVVDHRWNDITAEVLMELASHRVCYELAKMDVKDRTSILAHIVRYHGSFGEFFNWMKGAITMEEIAGGVLFPMVVDYGVG